MTLQLTALTSADRRRLRDATRRVIERDEFPHVTYSIVRGSGVALHALPAPAALADDECGRQRDMAVDVLHAAARRIQIAAQVYAKVEFA